MPQSISNYKERVLQMDSRLLFATMCALAAFSSVDAQQLALTGTCASIGYSTACCPPGENCQASDGNCRCSADCHSFDDCCSDVHCPALPRTCGEIGFTSCCSDAIGQGICNVYLSATNRCSCNMSCHLRNDCCPDAETIGCVPRTCTEAGKPVGCCSWTSSSSCHVSGGNCYCDSYCVVFNDCCDDVPMPQCSAGNSRRSRTESNLQQENYNVPLPFNARYLKPHQQNIYNDRYAHQRDILAARAQRTYPREFRARARTAVRRPPA